MTKGQEKLQLAAVTQFAHELVAATLNRELHGRDSQFVGDSLRAMVTALRRAAAVGVDMPLELRFAGDRIDFDGTPLVGPSLQARALLSRCRERHIAALAFGTGMDTDEANRCLDLLLLPQHEQAFSRERRDAAFAALGIQNLRATPCAPGSSGVREAEPTDQALHRYQDLADCLQQNHMRARRDMELAVDAAEDVVERTVAQFDEPSLLLSLAAQDDVDRFTVGHSVRVALLALQVARALGADREQLVHVGTAALMHDIGKSKVPQQILFKPGALSTEEWHWMAQHPRLGAQILLEQHSEVNASAIGAAFCHHMGPTGRGYPQPTVPVAPSGISRLVRVCDVFEALTSVRPYKRALTPIEAYAVMFRNEQDFDPAWLRRFARTLGLFPTGSRVHLDCGSEALVTAQGECPEQPRVRLLSGPGGTALPAGHPTELAIGAPFEGRVPRISGVTTHDRCIAVPEFDLAEPEVLTSHANHACVSTTLARDAAAIRPAAST
ncbi:MAG TPA: HD domain-containing phosphohydrolase [Planctomycetota bacterium]|nr:HD domain-containing phosphohydrolase [Planctomycetota bacterium]